VEAGLIDVQGNKLTKSLDGLTTVRLQKVRRVHPPTPLNAISPNAGELC
jgi:hypothetical protein